MNAAENILIRKKVLRLLLEQDRKMKELFLSSMMQWMATVGGVPMDEIITGQAAQLREQAVAAVATAAKI
jgi:hypothetical protein